MRGGSIRSKALSGARQGKHEHFPGSLRLVSDEHQPGHNRRMDEDSHERGE